MANGSKISVVQIGPMPPPHGGVSTNMLAIHEALKAGGHKSVIVDVTNRNEQSEDDEVIKPHSAFGLVRVLLAADCDIVHYHIGGEFRAKLAWLTLLCGSLPGKKSVVTFHSGGYAERMVAHASSWSLRGFAFRSVDFLIGVNPQMSEMFRRFGVPANRTRCILPFELRSPDPSVMIPKDLLDFANASDPLLLSVGGLEPEYLNRFMIESMPKIIERFPNAGLMIAGSGSMEAVLAEQIAEIGLGERVCLAGNIDHDVLLHLIQAADSLLRLTEYDGDAISIREALYLGTPVIATDNGMRPDRVHLVSNQVTADELCATLSSVLSQAEKPRPNRDNESNATKVIDLYRSLLGK